MQTNLANLLQSKLKRRKLTKENLLVLQKRHHKVNQLQALLHLTRQKRPIIKINQFKTNLVKWLLYTPKRNTLPLINRILNHKQNLWKKQARLTQPKSIEFITNRERISSFTKGSKSLLIFPILLQSTKNWTMKMSTIRCFPRQANMQSRLELGLCRVPRLVRWILASDRQTNILAGQVRTSRQLTQNRQLGKDLANRSLREQLRAAWTWDSSMRAHQLSSHSKPPFNLGISWGLWPPKMQLEGRPVWLIKRQKQAFQTPFQV